MIFDFIPVYHGYLPVKIGKKPRHEKMNTERFLYCDSDEDGFLDMIEFEDYLFPHKSFK